MDRSSELTLLDLPLVVQTRIFNFFTYKELSRIRAVCHAFSEICAFKSGREFYRLHSEVHRFTDEIKNEFHRTPPEKRAVRERDRMAEFRPNFICFLL